MPPSQSQVPASSHGLSPAAAMAANGPLAAAVSRILYLLFLVSLAITLRAPSPTATANPASIAAAHAPTCPLEAATPKATTQGWIIGQDHTCPLNPDHLPAGAGEGESSSSTSGEIAGQPPQLLELHHDPIHTLVNSLIASLLGTIWKTAWIYILTWLWLHEKLRSRLSRILAPSTSLPANSWKSKAAKVALFVLRVWVSGKWVGVVYLAMVSPVTEMGFLRRRKIPLPDSVGIHVTALVNSVITEWLQLMEQPPGNRQEPRQS